MNISNQMCPQKVQIFLNEQKKRKDILRKQSCVNFKQVLIEHLTSMRVRDILLNGSSSRIGLEKEDYALIRQEMESKLMEDTNMMSTYGMDTVLKKQNGTHPA